MKNTRTKITTSIDTGQSIKNTYSLIHNSGHFVFLSYSTFQFSYNYLWHMINHPHPSQHAEVKEAIKLWRQYLPCSRALWACGWLDTSLHYLHHILHNLHHQDWSGEPNASLTTNTVWKDPYSAENLWQLFSISTGIFYYRAVYFYYNTLNSNYFPYIILLIKNSKENTCL